jgi:uracil-DNA glycosylase family 4
MDKTKALEKVAQEIKVCSLCKIDKIGEAVPGEGNADADIVFVGEAPGKTEAQTGRPFVGRSGKLLRSLIQEVGLNEEEVYITSPVKYLPKRGTPTPQDIQHGRIHFLKQLDIIEPKIIVLLGSVAVQGVLGEKVPVMKKHGTTIQRDNRLYFFTLHPAAGLRFAKLKIIIKEDFKTLKDLLKSHT